jgi:hypothetical protein
VRSHGDVNRGCNENLATACRDPGLRHRFHRHHGIRKSSVCASVYHQADQGHDHPKIGTGTYVPIFYPFLSTMNSTILNKDIGACPYSTTLSGVGRNAEGACRGGRPWPPAGKPTKNVPRQPRPARRHRSTAPVQHYNVEEQVHQVRQFRGRPGTAAPTRYRGARLRFSV